MLVLTSLPRLPQLNRSERHTSGRKWRCTTPRARPSARLRSSPRVAPSVRNSDPRLLVIISSVLAKFTVRPCGVVDHYVYDIGMLVIRRTVFRSMLGSVSIPLHVSVVTIVRSMRAKWCTDGPSPGCSARAAQAASTQFAGSRADPQRHRWRTPCRR